MRAHIREASALEKRTLGSARILRGVETFARTDKNTAVTHDVWDADPMLLGTPGGVVDLRTGIMAKADPASMMTRSTVVSPAGGKPECWCQFIQEVTNGDGDLANYIQRVLGYCLTGSTREHALFQAIGEGGNGKSVLLNTAGRILGDYATTAGMETFTAAKGDRHPTDIARLDGARLVAASETTEGRAWDEARIKQLTGGDRIAARYMRQDFFEFTPLFKLLIVANHPPVLRQVDAAMRRRFHVIPFNHKPAKPDPDLEEKLASEHPQILAWMIDGARKWVADGLCPPAAVAVATEQYLAGEDVLGQWLDDECSRDNPTALTLKSKAYESWARFARDNGQEPGTQNSLTRNLERRGIHERRTSMGRFYVGLQMGMTQ